MFKYRYCTFVPASLVACQLPLSTEEQMNFASSIIYNFEGHVTFTLHIMAVVRSFLLMHTFVLILMVGWQ